MHKRSTSRIVLRSRSDRFSDAPYRGAIFTHSIKELERRCAGTQRPALVERLELLGDCSKEVVASITRLVQGGVTLEIAEPNINSAACSAIATVGEYMDRVGRRYRRDRVQVGLAQAKLQGVHRGRLRTGARPADVAGLRESGLSWREISSRLGASVRTVRRRYAEALATQRDKGDRDAC